MLEIRSRVMPEYVLLKRWMSLLKGSYREGGLYLNTTPCTSLVFYLYFPGTPGAPGGPGEQGGPGPDAQYCPCPNRAGGYKQAA